MGVLLPWPFDRGYLQLALVACVVVGAVAPLVGGFLVQRRMSLLGDGIGHVAFAGVAAGLLMGVWPIWTALVAAVAALLALAPFGAWLAYGSRAPSPPSPVTPPARGSTASNRRCDSTSQGAPRDGRRCARNGGSERRFHETRCVWTWIFSKSLC